MQIGLILLVLAFPLLELAVMIKVGQSLGVWVTILILIATGVVGGLIIQAQGITAAQRAAQSLQEGRPPLEPVVDSFMLMLAGLLLAVPGFISDAMALPLLVPPTRRAIARWGLSRLLARAEVHVETREWRSPGPGGAPGDGGGRGGSGTTIDGEWERVDDPKQPPSKPTSGDRLPDERHPRK